MLHADAFGSAVPNLLHLFVDNNQINYFDPELFESATRVAYLFLNGNNCVNRDFYNVWVNRDETRASLEGKIN